MSIWRPSTTAIVAGGVVLILVALAASYMVTHFQPTTEVRLGSGVFNTRLATNDSARLQGLSGIEKMSADSGLLMVYQSDAKWGIWMKDMKVPLDIIWMNNDKKVIYMVIGAAPELGISKIFTPTNPARYVLEVPSGSVKNAGIKVGDRATFSVRNSQ